MGIAEYARRCNIALEHRSGSLARVRSGCCIEHRGRDSDNADDGLSVGSTTGTGLEDASLVGRGLDPLGRAGRFKRRSVR